MENYKNLNRELSLRVQVLKTENNNLRMDNNTLRNELFTTREKYIALNNLIVNAVSDISRNCNVLIMHDRQLQSNPIMVNNDANKENKRNSIALVQPTQINQSHPNKVSRTPSPTTNTVAVVQQHTEENDQFFQPLRRQSLRHRRSVSPTPPPPPPESSTVPDQLVWSDSDDDDDEDAPAATKNISNSSSSSLKSEKQNNIDEILEQSVNGIYHFCLMKLYNFFILCYSTLSYLR